jgi:hypothetical protein
VNYTKSLIALTQVADFYKTYFSAIMPLTALPQPKSQEITLKLNFSKKFNYIDVGGKCYQAF